MTDKQPKALRLPADLQSAVQTYPQMSEDEPGGYCRQEDALMDDAATELRRLHAQNAQILEALRMNAQALAWLANGKCRGFHQKLPTANVALDAARAAIEAVEKKP